MAEKIFQLGSRPGIKRDGTEFDSDEYTDGVWCRFNRGRPRKVRGYTEVTAGLDNTSRGLFLHSTGGTNLIASGHSGGINSISQNNTTGASTGFDNYTLPTEFAANPNNLWSFDAVVDVSGDGKPLVLLAHAGQNLQNIDNNVDTNVFYGNIGDFTNEMKPLEDYQYLGPYQIIGDQTSTPAVPTSVVIGPLLWSFDIAENPFGLTPNSPAVKTTVSLWPGSVAVPPTDRIQNGIASFNNTTNKTTFVGGVSFSNPGVITRVVGAGQYVVFGNPFNLPPDGTTTTTLMGLYSTTANLNATSVVQANVFTFTARATSGSPGETDITITSANPPTLAVNGNIWTAGLVGMFSPITFLGGGLQNLIVGQTKFFTNWTGGPSQFNIGDELQIYGSRTTPTVLNNLPCLPSGTKIVEIYGTGQTNDSYIRVDQGLNSNIQFFINTNLSGVVTYDTEPYPVNDQLQPFDDTWQAWQQKIVPIQVSGGVVQLHPFTFVYGDNGLIKNNDVSTTRVPLQTWTGGLAQEVNAASTKIVAALPIRGGSNSPSGLFWSLNSLVRVSFTSTQFRYDTVSADTSIMSSKCVAEIDGIYYWIGTDRFYIYNGVVQELPNDKNLNYFFDGLNFQQRQKVFALVLKRWGEIWWFYPRGGSTQIECNDAIIYNYREKLWYDMGMAEGCRRSAAAVTQVYQYPLLAANDTAGSITPAFDRGNPVISNDQTRNRILLADGASFPSGLAVGSLVSPFQTGPFTNVTALDTTIGWISVNDSGAWGEETGGNFSPVNRDFWYAAGTSRITSSLWQHETGLDRNPQASGGVITPITSAIETSDLSWSGGGVSQRAAVTDQFSMRISRIEPDFNGQGTMQVMVIGRKYPQSSPEVVRSYDFNPVGGNPTTGAPATEKTDMREQRRLIRLRFVNNVSGGDFEMGRILIHAEEGDDRPSGG